MKQVFTVPFENEPAFLKKILSAAGQAGIQTGPSARWEPFRQAVKILLPFFNSFGGSCVGLRDEPSNRFCLRLTAGRGTAHQPGRMLALKEGGRTTGVAYRLPEETLEQELTLLWKREMITGCYLPTWCQLDLDDGRTVNAIVFIMDPRHPEYESDTRAQVIAPLIAAASGPLGTNAQYLFSLEQELIKLGMQDDGLNELLVSVKKLLAENYPDGVLRPGFA